MPGINIINTESFAEIRQNYGYYVDKTGFLQEFLRDPGDADRFRSPGSVALFTRPRRFGKTLFMDMLASFFEDTLALSLPTLSNALRSYYKTPVIVLIN